ncbi:GNAT family N-acetyltransferase [Dysgonomonas mossii]|uniref:GNAT family N-acetyltransferase n=1 Tax=Dysgonomonas mossii TaxID=163665 RepID=UPI003994E750
MNDRRPVFKILSSKDIPEISILGQQLNPSLSTDQILGRLTQMFEYPNYRCFGLYIGQELMGIVSGWITVRLYSGKQIELDNAIIESSVQSQGLGKFFFDSVEAWAKQNQCCTIELNTYIENSKSHKFYFKEGYSILGFHFQKQT